MEIMGKAPRSSHYAETAGIFTAFFYRSKPYQAAASIARSRRPQDRTLFDRADAVKPLEDSPRCRWRTWNLCSCLLSPIPSTSGDHRGTSQGRSYYPPRGQERKDGKTGAGHWPRYCERSVAARIRLSPDLQCLSRTGSQGKPRTANKGLPLTKPRRADYLTRCVDEPCWNAP
jgi:hypothetical protein